MEAKYKFGHRPARRRRTRIVIIVTISALIIGAVGSVIWFDLSKSGDSPPVETQGRSVAQALDEDPTTATINEPTFTMRLPSDWKPGERISTQLENSTTWNATASHQANRYLKIYVDTIPKTYPVNQMLPLVAQGVNLAVGDVSSNCATFTKLIPQNGRQDISEPAKWQGVDFLCDLSNTINNVTGTSSTEGVNTISVTGPTKGKHSYFFVYTDHNIQPDSSIFTNALKSFKAK